MSLGRETFVNVLLEERLSHQAFKNIDGNIGWGIQKLKCLLADYFHDLETIRIPKSLVRLSDAQIGSLLNGIPKINICKQNSVLSEKIL